MQVFNKKKDYPNARLGTILKKFKIWIIEHKQLTFEQRYVIEQMLKDKHSKRSIISILELVVSTFYRKLKRNSKKLVYTAKHSGMLVENRKNGSLQDCIQHRNGNNH